jgi:hypothetical protein
MRARSVPSRREPGFGRRVASYCIAPRIAWRKVKRRSVGRRWFKRAATRIGARIVAFCTCYCAAGALIPCSRTRFIRHLSSPRTLTLVAQPAVSGRRCHVRPMQAPRADRHYDPRPSLLMDEASRGFTLIAAARSVIASQHSSLTARRFQHARQSPPHHERIAQSLHTEREHESLGYILPRKYAIPKSPQLLSLAGSKT